MTCWHKSLLFLAVFLLIAIIDRKLAPPRREGFTLSKKYVEKNGNDVFDHFYVEVYDSLYKSTAKDKITTNIDKKNFNSGSYKYLRGFFLKTAK